MRRYILLVSIALVPCTACQRDPGAPQPADSGGSTGPPAASLTTTQHDSAQPVLRWECDGGTTLTTKYLPRDRAISLGLHEGERKLPQVASASGEKYQDGPITFWRKGADAIYERTPAPSIDCRLGSGGSATGT
jgi:membrane-bound inhibitor of C-type lysozyme